MMSADSAAVPRPAEFNSESAAIAALNHARAMVVYAAEQRLKDFSLFILIAGVLVAAVVKLEPSRLSWTVFVAGVVISLLFFVLDVRAEQLIKDARADLYRFEPRFGLTIHEADRLADPARAVPPSGRNRLISHALVYRAVFVLTAIMCLWALLTRG